MLAGGSFYLYTRQPSSWNFFFGGRSLEREKAIDARVDGVLSRNLSLSDSGSPRETGCLDLEEGALHTKSFRCDGAGVTVAYCTKAIAGELYLVKPAVYQNANEICVFYGFLSNPEEVMDLLKANPQARPDVSTAQDGELAAELLLHMFRSTSTKDLLIMLSELQGHYAFVVYDSNRKQAFAARDPSGMEGLYFCTDDDGGLSFTNKPFDVPGGERESDWMVVPPGHFIAGKSPRLKQFALTPEQLREREMFEASDSPSSLSTSPQSPSSWGPAPSQPISCTSACRQTHPFEASNMFRLSI